jgi:hypothetical protein
MEKSVDVARHRHVTVTLNTIRGNGTVNYSQCEVWKYLPKCVSACDSLDIFAQRKPIF